MTELLRVLIDVWTFVWPFRAVEQWQRGCYYVFGRCVGTVGPGRWPVVPYFMNVIACDMVPSIHVTPLQTVTLRDGRLVTFSATIRIRAIDAAKALNMMEHWTESALELVSGMLSECLADADPDRFDPARGKRRRLLREIRRSADAETRKFGVSVRKIRLNNFLLGVRAYRLLTEPSTILPERYRP